MYLGWEYEGVFITLVQLRSILDHHYHFPFPQKCVSTRTLNQSDSFLIPFDFASELKRTIICQTHMIKESSKIDDVPLERSKFLRREGPFADISWFMWLKDVIYDCVNE